MASALKRTLTRYQISLFRKSGADISGDVITTTREIARHILKDRSKAALMVERGNLVYSD